MFFFIIITYFCRSIESSLQKTANVWDHEPNLIHWIKYMKNAASESIGIWNGSGAQTFFPPSPAGNFAFGATLERL